jgi:phage baseplate assembly protein W
MYEVDFIGAGWSYPLGTDASGRVSLVTREREIEQSIRLILGTAIGERPMRPDFGCRIHDHVFGPANSATAGQVAYDVREALERWETRIEITEVKVSFDRINDGMLYVDVGYAIRGLNDPRNLVFPFYVIPEEGESTLLAMGPTRPSGQPALDGSTRAQASNGLVPAVPVSNGLGSLLYPSAAPARPGTAPNGGA